MSITFDVTRKRSSADSSRPKAISASFLTKPMCFTSMLPLASEFFLPVLDHCEGRRRYSTGRRHDEPLAIWGNIELKVPSGAVLGDPRDKKQSFGLAKFERPLNGNRVHLIV